MNTEQTEAGVQGVIDDGAVKRKVPTKAKKGGGDLEGTPLGDRVVPNQCELFPADEPDDGSR